ncbi:hypothetical protein SLS53_000390 [Cytospora paraplurivora]|uniref:DUF6590 domain-containing protein n=1 Tax=Cytospora paraplurivora TaxID=2898453 RepID=A0AAN9YPW0_9PEZI
MADRSRMRTHLVADKISDGRQEHSVLQQGLVMDKVLHLFRAVGLDIPPSKEAPTAWADPVMTMMKKHFGLGSKPAVTYTTMEVLEKCLPEEALSTRVEPSSRFEPGEVFKVMWHEPKGAPIGGGSVITEFVALQDHMDEVWTGFRRFIIIANDEGHCTCVPILTYGNQGCRKAGVKPSKHGIVYEQGTAPATLQHEPKLGFDPVRMQMTANNEHISGQSRVNYSKLVTVEHNVKVFFIGRILLDDWDIVRNAVDECWTAKTRDKSHHSNRRSKR